MRPSLAKSAALVLAVAAAACSAQSSTTTPEPMTPPPVAAAPAAPTPPAPPAPPTPPAPPAPPAPAAPAAPAQAPSPAAVSSPAPEFTLPDPDGKTHSLADYRGKWVVLEWTNHGCPYVKRHYGANTIQALQTRYAAKNVAWLSICSSAPGKEGHETPAQWKATLAEKRAVPTAMLLDPDGKAGRAYGAKTTPHMFVIDPRGVIVYRGAIDDRPKAKTAEEMTSAHNYVAAALDAGMAGKPIDVPETKPYG
jgi:peroxiredoxin